MTATVSNDSILLPLFDLFLDLPHPWASPECPGAFIIPAPPVIGSSNSSSSNNNNNNNTSSLLLQQITPMQVAQFAFPEVSTAQPPPAASGTTNNTRLNAYDLYAMQTTSSHFTFSWQLADGSRMHGHVRRYLPSHLFARTRYDVGRRGERALVLLTRHSTTADALFTAILKSIDAISSQQVAVRSGIHNGNPQQWFLHQLVAEATSLLQAPPSLNNNNNKPIVATITNLEFDNDLFARCDTHRFILPTSLLLVHRHQDEHHHHQHNSAILPLLRCVGISHCLRILSALLSERRIVFCSASPTRLTKCSHAALSMLNAGGLSWQHVFIPVLCPHIHTMLAAPYPYLIGILQPNVLNTVDGVGEVLICHLDYNRLETRGISEAQVMARLPDIVLAQEYDDNNTLSTTMNNNNNILSPCDMFIQDLSEVLKQDKKLLYGDSALERVGETAAKAKEAVRKTFSKLRDRFQQKGSDGTMTAAETISSTTSDNNNNDDPMTTVDAIATESCHNETAEQEVRIACCIFFLTFYGDVRWYLTKSSNGTVALDRNRFLQNKQREYPMTSPMWQLAQNFCQTQLLEEFAKARIAEIGAASSSSKSLLFFQCELYLRQKHLDFGVSTVQRIARHIADNSPVRLTGMPITDARPTAMNLTSNKAYDSPETNRMMAQLVEQCRECSSVLTDVMSVIWMRLRDSKGLQWKHAFLSLQLLRNLLYHGPLTAITEATDGLSKIRSLKFYENIRAQCAQQVQSAATSVYCLLVDRAKLFLIRRKCADRRRKVHDPSANVQRRRQPHATLGLSFRKIHALMHPSASSGTIVQIPPKAQVMSREGNNETLLSHNDQDFGSSDDVLGLFGDMSIGTAMNSSSIQDFEAFTSPQLPIHDVVQSQTFQPQHGGAGVQPPLQQQKQQMPLHQQQQMPLHQHQQMPRQQQQQMSFQPQQMPFQPQQMSFQQNPSSQSQHMQQQPLQHLSHQQQPFPQPPLSSQQPNTQSLLQTHVHPYLPQMQRSLPQASPPHAAVPGKTQVFIAMPEAIQPHQQQPPSSQTNGAMGFALAPHANVAMGFLSPPLSHSGTFAPDLHQRQQTAPSMLHQPTQQSDVLQHQQQNHVPRQPQYQQQATNRMSFDPFAKK